MKKLRVSYSLLNTWAKGDIQGTVDQYLHRGQISTPEAAEGQRIHGEWQSTIKETNALTVGKTTLKFKTPLCEKEIITPYNGQWDLKGYIDCLDTPRMYEFKTGRTDIMAYTTSYQIPFYFLLTDRAGIHIDECYLLHYNQYEREAGLFILRNWADVVAAAENYVESLAPEIYDYFNKLHIL